MYLCLPTHRYNVLTLALLSLLNAVVSDWYIVALVLLALLGRILLLS